MRTEHTRSTKTISHGTELVNTFFDDASEKKFSVRRLSVRTDPNRQLFIVIIDDEFNSSDFKVAPYAEVTVIKDQMKFIVNPSKQYPSMKDMFNNINSAIEKSVFGFINKFQ